MLELDVELLCRAAPSKMATYIRDQTRARSEAAVSRSLLYLIEIEAVASDISRTWLSIAKDARSLLLALQQNASARLRHCAIERFGAWLKGKEWRAAWDALGGAQGIAQLLRYFSASQVYSFTRIVGRSVRGRPSKGKLEKREAVTQLLSLLVPQLSADHTESADSTGSINTDDRNLAHAYSSLVPACTPEMAYTVLFGQQTAMTLRGDQRHLLREHPQLFIQDALSSTPPKSNWLDQDKFLPAVLLAVTHDTSIQEDPEKLDRFLTRTIESILINGRQVGSGLLTPDTALIKKLFAQRRLDLLLRKRIIEIILRALSKLDHRVPSMAAALKEQAARSWSRAPSVLQSVLRELVLPESVFKRQTTFAKLQKHVRPDQRWALLQLMFCSDHQTPPSEVDAAQLLDDLLSTDPYWQKVHISVLLALPSHQALLLVDRIAARPSRDDIIILANHNSILRFTTTGRLLDVDMVRFELQRDHASEDRVSFAKAAVQDYMDRASRSSEAADREHLARSAMHWAVCSRSIDLYTRTVIWLRRFIRDVTVARSLFSEETLYLRETIQLLSGIPQILGHQVTAEQIHLIILSANKAIWEWFETTRKSLLEPSFSVQNTAGARLLIRPVVVERMRRIDRLQAHLGFDTDAISKLVWDDTVDLLIRIEKACMEPNCRRLGVYQISGLLGTEIGENFFSSDALTIRSAAGFSFVEKLFIARDALWKQHRIGLNPAVAKLPRGVPQGLPLHVATSIWDLSQFLPRHPDCFLLQRAKCVVFAEAEVLLQPLSQSEDTGAAEECHEDYTFCLLLLIKAQRSISQKQRVVEAAFWHAVAVLSKRMPMHEAEAELRENFSIRLHCHAIPIFPSLFAPSPYPQLPSSRDAEGTSRLPIEWDPNMLGSPPTFSRRELENTIFDEMLDSNAWLNMHDGTLCYYSSEFSDTVPMRSPRNVRERPQRRALDVPLVGCKASNQGLDGNRVVDKNGQTLFCKDQIRTIREAQIAWHLMLYDEICLGVKTGQTALRLPFPDPQHARYPRVVLSRSFVDTARTRLEDDRLIAHMLKHLRSRIPPSILRDLTQRIMAARANKQLSWGDQLPTHFLRSLIASDRPSEAVELVLRSVLDNAEDSSWHRVLFSQRFLERLPASDACKVMTKMAAEILQRTGARSSDSKGSGAGIKISTVKMLAQTLGRSDIVPITVAVDTLAKLLDRSDHTDVRFAALSSMLELICTRPSTDDALTKRLIPELDRFVHVLAALDENHPAQSFEEWGEGVLPGVYERVGIPSTDLDCMKGLPRTFELVSQMMTKHKLWAPILMQRTVLPAMEESIKLHRRWLDRFLSRFSLSVDSLGLPVPPVKPEMLNILLTQHAALTPDWIADLYCQHLLFNIRPPAQVKGLKRKLKNTEDNAEKHWLATTSKPKLMYSGSPPFLQKFVYGVAESASSQSAIHDMLKERAYAVSRAEEVLHAMLDDMLESSWVDEQSFGSIVSQLRHQSFGDGKTVRARSVAWQLCLRPILEKVIAKVDGLRTPDWQRNVGRKPRFLPSMMRHRLDLLPYPEDAEPALSAEEKVRQCKAFADAIAEHVKALVSRGMPYKREMSELRFAATNCAVIHQAGVALALGQLDTGDHVECLCVDIAAKLLLTASCTTEEVESIQKMVEAWSRCEVEWIRTRLDELVGARSSYTMNDAKLEKALREKEMRDSDDDDTDEDQDEQGPPSDNLQTAIWTKIDC
ncbi:hypothetical protein PHSY_004144 [Pseudozyma hubeiensis SY62]|uniref:Uncharacterized protein n=1 Tax=Pseudozyma hubeiensis (strain SY62) TaxID=1305764 RepID=R9P543_PSEHS|nr:hypothetical protein PHSY_004144 [Pseudozyma hubeiensis SY62]GAC96563.1 hypothetical protein PHSY_004144 [Pseudozyma hubeiensis SY62]